MTRLRFVAPAGTPISVRDIGWWLHHAVTDRDTIATFEDEIRMRIGVRYCTFVSTGRAALTLALRALRQLDGGRRCEVAIPSYTCFSVASSVVKAGLKIRLVDIEPSTLDLSRAALEELDGSRTLAVVATNLYGLPNDLPGITKLAHSRHIFVVDDAAQCLGGSVGGRASGTWGDVGIYSLDKGKNITSIDGGVLVSNSEAVAAALHEQTRGLEGPTLGHRAAGVVKLVAYAAMLNPSRYWVPNGLPFLGLGATVFRADFPLGPYDPWLAPMGRRLFAKLEAITATRVDNAAHLRRALTWSERLHAVTPHHEAVPVYLRFPVLMDPSCRNAAVTDLNHRGIGATASYPTAICDIPGIGEYVEDPRRDMPGGKRVASAIVTLPTHPYVTPADREVIATSLAAVAGKEKSRGVEAAAGASGRSGRILGGQTEPLDRRGANAS